MERTDGPTFIALTRQVVPILNEIDAEIATRRGTARRLHRETRERAAGTDHSVMWKRIAARARGRQRTGRGHACRFDAMHGTFQSRIGGISRRGFAEKCRKRVAIEAGVPEIWYQYVGLDGKVIGLHRFGLSAPGAEVMKEFGIDAQHVIDAAKSLG